MMENCDLKFQEALGIPYLGKATKEEKSKVVKCIVGCLHGYKSHPILPCVVHTDGGEARLVGRTSLWAQLPQQPTSHLKLVTL